MASIKIGRGEKDLEIYLPMLNRHGLITGSTGSGKTSSVKLIIEKLSEEGIPVLVTDIKGDLLSLSKKGSMNDNIKKRMGKIDIKDFAFSSFPIEVFDILDELGIPLRTTISEMGPRLLSKLLGLNKIQEGILNTCFSVADEKGYFLYDLKDMYSMLNYIYDYRDQYERKYGNISKASIGAILRSLNILEKEGGDIFFGELAFDINDLFRLKDNKGIINIINAKELFKRPNLYSVFLIWILSEIYERKEEVGDLDKPRLVIFFDEAHLIFNGLEDDIKKEIQLILRLIRSKGIGVFFISQDPSDIPEEIINQCANRIQHQFRVNTGNGLKKVKMISDTYNNDNDLDIFEEIIKLENGQVLASLLDENGKSLPLDKYYMYPFRSFDGVIDSSNIMKIVNNSQLLEKYGERIDSISAYELILELKKNELKKIEEEKLIEEKKKEIREIERREKLERQEELRQKRNEERRRNNSMFSRFTKSVVASMGREIGRQFTRGILNILKK